MKVYRLSKKKYASKLSGKGASLSNNRWNSKGTEVLYTSQSRALAMSEVAVHIPMSLTPLDYIMLEIEIPDDIKIDICDQSSLPSDWNSFSYLDETKHVGDQFISKGEYLFLRVPSAVVEGDFNYLINLNHPDAKRIKVVSSKEFKFDDRLFK